MPKYPLDINPTSDIFVQYLFAVKGHEHFLLSFVNAVLENAGRPRAVRLEVQNSINLERFPEDKRTVVDIKALDETGRTIEIEVQTLNHPSFINRTLYYACRNYSGQLGKGKCYEILKPVISIALTRFSLFPQFPELHNTFFLMKKDFPDSILTDHLEMHYLELTNEKIGQFSQNPSELRSWLDFFFYANREKEAEMEVLLDPKTIARNAYETYRSFCQSDKLRLMAEMEEKEERDRQSIISELNAEAKAEGRAEGRAEGEARGEAKGRAEGEARARAEVLIQFLRVQFGKAETAGVEKRIRRISSRKKLDQLLACAFRAKSLEEIEAELDAV